MPKVSVLMPAYNVKEEYLRKAVESILNQTFKDFEFIILDDCSDRDIAPIIQSYNDNRIRFYRNEKNLGIAASRNRLMDLACWRSLPLWLRWTGINPLCWMLPRREGNPGNISSPQRMSSMRQQGSPTYTKSGGRRVMTKTNLTPEQISEIQAAYRDSANPKKQIGILADLYDTTENMIREMLGLPAEPDGAKKKRIFRSYDQAIKENVVRAVLLEGMTNREAAEKFAVPYGNVSAWVNKARKKQAEFARYADCTI